jgi:hypothetical protein
MTKRRAMEGWRIQCTDCAYGDRFGEARINAELACVRHRNRVHHKIGLYRVELAYMFGEMEGQQTLVLDHDENAPPF